MSPLSAEKLLSYTILLHEVSSHDELIPELPARLKALLGASKVSMVLISLSPQQTEVGRVTHASGLGLQEAQGAAENDWVHQLLADRKAAAEAGRTENAVRVGSDGRVQALYRVSNEHAIAFDIQTPAATYTITEQGKHWLFAMLEQMTRNLKGRLNRPGLVTQSVSPLSELTKGEWRVLLAIDGDDQEKEIADKLSLSTHTVHSHIKQVYRVMGVRSRMGAIAMLHRAERLAMLQELMPSNTTRDALKVRGTCGASTEADGLPGWAKRAGKVDVPANVRVTRPFDRLTPNAVASAR
jgi:DNA-binding CsgD family transcriptional regulator